MSRGRLPVDDRAGREDAILDAALAQLIEDGPSGLSMLAVAQRAHASKETLYSWFGSKDGLITALIERNADRAMFAVDAGLANDDIDPRRALTDFSVGLLTLLTAPGSVALNRAAMSSPELAERLLASGRFRVGPVVERYLAGLHERQVIRAPDPAESFELLYGLVVRDLPIRVLLRDPTPAPASFPRRAAVAVDQFLRLCEPG